MIWRIVRAIASNAPFNNKRIAPLNGHTQYLRTNVLSWNGLIE